MTMRRKKRRRMSIGEDCNYKTIILTHICIVYASDFYLIQWYFFYLVTSLMKEMTVINQLKTVIVISRVAAVGKVIS